MPENIVVLVEKYLAGTISSEEKATLQKWYQSFDDSEVRIESQDGLTEDDLALRMRDKLLASIQPAPVISLRQKFVKRMAAAAAVLILVAAGYYFVSRNGKQHNEPGGKETSMADGFAAIVPGGDKALLKLADGSTIVLDSAGNGLIVEQGNVKVEKLSNGLLSYSIDGRPLSPGDAAFYNTISTPRGGQYQVTLSDGTRVWLNAASSVKFPVVFTGKERRIEITGEAYLEVAKNAAMPFKVNAAHTEVEVLGTHFNVNAYEDEPAVRTTLLEGKVKVSALAAAGTQTPTFLLPGQQAGVTNKGKMSVNKNADLEEAVAWKNGMFQYKSTDVKTIMRQLARWYDVEVEYRGNISLHFTGQLKRKENISSVLEKLALTEAVHFRIEGRKIIVTP